MVVFCQRCGYAVSTTTLRLRSDGDRSCKRCGARHWKGEPPGERRIETLHGGPRQ